MTISMRMPGSDTVFSPQRDWVECMPVIIRRVSSLLQEDAWPAVYETVVAAMRDTTGEQAWAELCKAHDCYYKFLTTCTLDCNQTIEDVLRESGFLAVHPAAQVGYLAMLANLFTGHLFSGLRDVTELGKKSDLVADLRRYDRTSIDARRLLNGMTRGDDLKVDLATILNMLRNEQVPWSVIDRIVAREKALDPDQVVA